MVKKTNKVRVFLCFLILILLLTANVFASNSVRTTCRNDHNYIYQRFIGVGETGSRIYERSCSECGYTTKIYYSPTVDFSVNNYGLSPSPEEISPMEVCQYRPYFEIITSSGAFTTLKENVDYIVTYSNFDRVGTATLTISGINNYCGSKSFYYQIVPPESPFTKGYYSHTFYSFTNKLKKKKSFDICAESEYGEVIYKKISGNKKIKVSKNGRVTAAKGLKKGKYKIKVRMVAKGACAYTAKKTKTITIKVKQYKVYWTRSGSVYHLDPDCPGLSWARSIMSGTRAQSHKRKACRICR